MLNESNERVLKKIIESKIEGSRNRDRRKGRRIDEMIKYINE